MGGSNNAVFSKHSGFRDAFSSNFAVEHESFFAVRNGFVKPFSSGIPSFHSANSVSMRFSCMKDA